MKKVNFVVTDLDDTIWDWLTMWYESFNPYFNRIKNEFNINSKTLKECFKHLHQKYGTTEASHFVHDLACLTDEQKKKFDKPVPGKKSILHEYNSNKKHNLKLYDDVLDTLIEIKKSGAIIVGFTESHGFYTKYRIKHLNLDGIIDYIYAPIDMGLPDVVTRYYPEDYWEPKITEMRYCSKSTRKPDSEILEIILQDFGVRKEDAIYIGDKLDRDILMAENAGITSVYAEYGNKIDHKSYQLLRDVTHWTDADVQREIEFKKNLNKNIIPKFTLKQSFNELLRHFEFTKYEKAPKSEDIANIIMIWEKTIDVQKHFNDLELRIRNYTLSTYTFIIAGTGFLLKEHIDIELFGRTIPSASLLPVLGLFVLFAFFFMDKYWYHRFLVGAVQQATFIENRWAKYLPELALTGAISKASPLTYRGYKIRSRYKFYFFYIPLFMSLFILAAVLFCWA